MTICSLFGLFANLLEHGLVSFIREEEEVGESTVAFSPVGFL